MFSTIESPVPSSPSLMSLGSSRVSSPFDLTATEALTDHTEELEAKGTKHPLYSFEDGNIVFRVEDTLYNVHRYFFSRDSSYFRTIFQGRASSEPCVLFGVSCADFDEFLAILYPTDFRQPTKKTTAQWTSILHLAAKWEFENIRLLAVDNLTAHALPVDKIVLGRRYGITDWLAGAYEAVCTRADPLTMDEGIQLGVEDVVRISAARQLYGTSKALHEAKYLVGDLREIFGLDKGIIDDEDGEKAGLKILEEQVADAQKMYLAAPIVPLPLGGCGGRSNRTHDWVNGTEGCPIICYNCSYLPESTKQKVKREVKEEKGRQLEDLREKLEARRQDQIGRRQRVSSFK